MKSVGLSYSALSEETIEVIERIRVFATCIGLAKRFGPKGGYLLYFSAHVPLSADLIIYLAEPLGVDAATELQEFANHFMDHVLVSPHQYGWGVAFDQNGRFVYLKLEISSLSQIDLDAYKHFFKKQIITHENMELTVWSSNAVKSTIMQT